MVLVTFCGNRDCGGIGACDRIDPGALAALSDSVDPSRTDEAMVLRYFAQELILLPCSDDHGVGRMVPSGSEFTIHIGGVSPFDGRTLYTAVYSGPAQTKSEWLTGSPEWSSEAALERFTALLDA